MTYRCASTARRGVRNVSTSDLQANYDLLPCPFCGEAHCHENGDDDYSGPYVQVGPAFGFEETLVDARVVCNTCHVSTSKSTASTVSVAATGEDVTRLAAIAMAIGDWNRRSK